MSDSYDDYEAKIQRAEQASPLWEMVKTEHDKQIEIAQAYERGWNAALAQLAAWMTRQGYATGHGDTIEDLLQELDWQVQERERESEGARVDASWASCTAAIRARVKQ